ncbi:hypothetical protein F5X99DRAFT_218255 [Biscogniauxia marginata]|nr:hypothetical protein F5X99DRAFT_218255 [Biscogniauxia marginata]
MSSMQRSLSSPVRIHSSPPVSPTAAHSSSRSPSPSPEPAPEKEKARSRRRRSRSPAESTASLPIRRSHETPRDGSSQHQTGASAPKKPVIDQAPVQPSVTPTRRSPVQSPIQSPLSSSPPQSVLKDDGLSPELPQPILTDLSMYTNPQLTLENEGTTLEELAHLVRLSKYQERKRANTRTRLQRSLISTALSARLTRCGEISLRSSADFFRKDDQQAFANLYSAIHDVRDSCDATRRYALLEPEMENNIQSLGMASSESLENPFGASGGLASGPATPFLNEISVSAREAFLHFLTQIRTNPDYLATRLCSLNNSELQALTVFPQALESKESVLPQHSRSSGRSGANNAIRTSGQGPNAVERLLSFQRHDPLAALIHTCFANSAGPGSAEDKRRTEVWANACARLISSKFPQEYNLVSVLTPCEYTLISVLNVWSGMRDWSGRSNMELFLMKILEEGAFLLDRAEDPDGTRFNISAWTSQDTEAATEFYDRAVSELFEIIDDPDATGIPEGVIELGNEILRRLDSRLVDNTRRWFVYKWLFSRWLLTVVIHPESFGMMAEYHITVYGRQKILKHVASRAQQLVMEMLRPHSPVSPPLKIRRHVENILGRFSPTRSPRTARLLPARSITSLRETVEVHPYLLISPVDLVTLINALFPERRPRSAHSGSVRSGAPSISGFSTISQPLSIATSRSNLETASVISMSASSVVSDATTSREPLLDSFLAGTPQRYSPPVPDAANQKKSSNYEDDGYQLRLATHEMIQILGVDAVAGSCHPCAERWAVLFVSADGRSLSLQMTYDPDDGPEDDSSITSDSEDEDPDDKPELDNNYHQLRDSILKLVEDFEIPQGLEDSGTRTTFSNRANGLKKYRSKNKVVTLGTTMGSRNPYRMQQEAAEKARQNAEDSSHSSSSSTKTKDSQDESEPNPVLITMLSAASSQSRVQSDFVSAHLYWRTLQQLNALTSPSLRKNGFAMLLNIFSRGPRDSIRRSASAIEEYDAWLVWLKQSQERHDGLIETMMKRLKALRDKTWYVTGVLVSKHYEHTRKICSALKIMGVPRRRGSHSSVQTPTARSSALNFVYLEESQMLDLLAANEEQGGPNKLSDDQAEKTRKWLEQSNIQNMCKGEERIHRFCCEIDNCIERLVGDSVSANPVLWSSPLYARDRRTLEGPPRGRNRERDSIWGGDDAASIISTSDYGRRYAASSNPPNSFARDLRNLSASNFSQISIDSGRHSYSRASGASIAGAMSDIMDAGEYFGVSSPIHTIDSSATFWSPFQSTQPSVSSATSRAQSPTTSVTNFSGSFTYPNHFPLGSNYGTTRPGTSTSSNETVHLQRSSEDKQRFLSELRQTLLSLMLSDLGNFVYAPGSETDGWFMHLGQECIDRREAEEQRARRLQRKRDHASKISKQRAIEKKRSSINLREVGDSPAGEQSTDRYDSPSRPGNDSSATSDTVSTPTPKKPSGRPSKKKDDKRDDKKDDKKDDMSEFPYKKAYQRLLRMFSVHPNPYTKLNTLFELEQLIIASLSTGKRRPRWTARSQFVSSEDSGGYGRAPSRRPTIFQPSIMSGIDPSTNANANAETRSVISLGPANKDAIAGVLRSLFCDPSIRPKTLFRDLQFINSFVSPSILDAEQNDAFWNIGLAALSLKQDVTTTMVEMADEAVLLSRKRSSGSSDGRPESPRPPMTHSLQDAARMLTIAAKEGDATAQRELGLLHLSNPELVERTTMPLSKPREVFKQTAMEKKFGARSGSSVRHPGDRARPGLGTAASAPSGMQDAGMDGDVRSDPALMCVAWHWMEAAENGGDEVARTFLRQDNEMMGMS